MSSDISNDGKPQLDVCIAHGVRRVKVAFYGLEVDLPHIAADDRIERPQRGPSHRKKLSIVAVSRFSPTQTNSPRSKS